MAVAMGQIELRIEGSVEEGWTAEWSLDSVAAGSKIRIGAADSARLAAEGRRFLALFERGLPPLVDPAMLSSLGAELARIWLDPAREPLAAALGAGGGELVVAGHDARALDLPWELIELYPGLPVGCDAAWTLRREVVADGAPRPSAPLPPPGGGPLRILFLASSPEDQEPLDLEREEDLLLRPTEGLRGEVIIHIAEVGTFYELRRLVGRVKPQLIHLSGHGNLNSNGEGVFAFETEEGETDLRTAEQIAEAVARGSSVRLLVLNACKSAQAGTLGLCRALATAGVPHALGWAASVEDGLATRFATALYGELMVGAPVGIAVARARWELRDRGKFETNEGPALDASFALSQLYGRGAGELIDLGKPKEVYDGPSTENVLLGDGVKGLKEGFIGRRRDVWKVLKAMRRGETTVTFLWGIGGSGKSTLATRVANRLHDDGFHILPVRAPDGDDPVAIGRETHSKLIGAMERAFQKAGRENFLGILRSETIAPEQRLRLAVEGLCEIRALLVLDNLEGALALETRRIVDPGLAFLVRLIATDLTRGSRFLITCRYEVADLEGLGVLGIEVKDFRPSDVRKFFRRDEKVEKRLHRGEIPLWLFDRLATELGGTPSVLETARTVLRATDPEDLLADLEGLEEGPLTATRREYLEKILARRLYDALSPKARSLASHLAVSNLPLPADGAAQIAGCVKEEAMVGLEEGVAYGLLQIFEEADLPTLYHPPGLLQRWLMDAGLSPSEIRDSHTRIANFWRESFENDRNRELRVPINIGLWACRLHAAAGGDRKAFEWATVQLSSRLHRRAEWQVAMALLLEIPQEDRGFEALSILGWLEFDLCDYVQSKAHLTAALIAPGRVPREEALIWHQLGAIDLQQGSYVEAREKLSRALSIRQSIGDHAGEAVTWHQLGSVAFQQGSYDEAREALGKALKIQEAIGDHWGASAALHQLGSIDARQDAYGAAREKFNRALVIKKEVGDRSGEAMTLASLGSVALDEGLCEEARENLDRALLIVQSIGDRSGEAQIWHVLGTISLEEGAFSQAREKLEKSLIIKKEIGNLSGHTATLAQLGAIDIEEGLYVEARERLVEALSILKTIGDKYGEAATEHQLGAIDLAEGSYEEAQAKFERSLAIKRSIGDRSGEAATLAQLGWISFRSGRTEAASHLMAVAFCIFVKIGGIGLKEISRNLGSLCKQLGYGEAEIKALLASARAEYDHDHGRSLVERALATTGEL